MIQVILLSLIVLCSGGDLFDPQDVMDAADDAYHKVKEVGGGDLLDPLHVVDAADDAYHKQKKADEALETELALANFLQPAGVVILLIVAALETILLLSFCCCWCCKCCCCSYLKGGPPLQPVVTVLPGQQQFGLVPAAGGQYPQHVSSEMQAPLLNNMQY